MSGLKVRASMTKMLYLIDYNLFGIFAKCAIFASEPCGVAGKILAIFVEFETQPIFVNPVLDIYLKNIT